MLSFLYSKKMSEKTSKINGVAFKKPITLNLVDRQSSNI